MPAISESTRRTPRSWARCAWRASDRGPESTRRFRLVVESSDRAIKFDFSRESRGKDPATGLRDIQLAAWSRSVLRVQASHAHAKRRKPSHCVVSHRKLLALVSQLVARGENGHSANKAGSANIERGMLRRQIAAMRLTAKKTWSQQQLAIKLRVETAERQRFLSWERQRLADPRGKDRAGSGALLVAGAALWTARRLLGLDQRHHRAAIERGRDGDRLARSHSGHADWRGASAFHFRYLARCRGITSWRCLRR